MRGGNVRTSGVGWRIVAFGTLVAIIGMSAMMNGVGPGWFGLLLLAAGALIIVYGRLN
jgi:hypothetical protein